MPKNSIIFLHHAESKIDSEIPVSKWDLSPKGYNQANLLLEKDFFQDVQVLISSSEKKAIETIKPLSEKLNIHIQVFRELNELNRDKGDFSSLQDYNNNVKFIFENPDKVVNNWETVNNALERFSSKIDEIDNQYSNKKILVVSHGIILNLYFAYIKEKKNLLYQRWSKKKFFDYGIIQNGAVVKDIASIRQEIYESK